MSETIDECCECGMCWDEFNHIPDSSCWQTRYDNILVAYRANEKLLQDFRDGVNENHKHCVTPCDSIRIQDENHSAWLLAKERAEKAEAQVELLKQCAVDNLLTLIERGEISTGKVAELLGVGYSDIFALHGLKAQLEKMRAAFLGQQHRISCIKMDMCVDCIKGARAYDEALDALLESKEGK